MVIETPFYTHRVSKPVDGDQIFVNTMYSKRYGMTNGLCLTKMFSEISLAKSSNFVSQFVSVSFFSDYFIIKYTGEFLLGLTHFCQTGYSIIIKWINPFVYKRVSDLVFFYRFYFILRRYNHLS